MSGTTVFSVTIALSVTIAIVTKRATVSARSTVVAEARVLTDGRNETERARMIVVAAMAIAHPAPMVTVALSETATDGRSETETAHSAVTIVETVGIGMTETGTAASPMAAGPPVMAEASATVIVARSEMVIARSTVTIVETVGVGMTETGTPASPTIVGLLVMGEVSVMANNGVTVSAHLNDALPAPTIARLIAVAEVSLQSADHGVRANAHSTVGHRVMAIAATIAVVGETSLAVDRVVTMIVPTSDGRLATVEALSTAVADVATAATVPMGHVVSARALTELDVRVNAPTRVAPAQAVRSATATGVGRVAAVMTVVDGAMISHEVAISAEAGHAAPVGAIGAGATVNSPRRSACSMSCVRYVRNTMIHRFLTRSLRLT